MDTIKEDSNVQKKNVRTNLKMRINYGGCYKNIVKYPETMEETKEFVEKYKINLPQAFGTVRLI
jgi:hypothetical protein